MCQNRRKLNLKSTFNSRLHTQNSLIIDSAAQMSKNYVSDYILDKSTSADAPTTRQQPLATDTAKPFANYSQISDENEPANTTVIIRKNSSTITLKNKQQSFDESKLPSCDESPTACDTPAAANMRFTANDKLRKSLKKQISLHEQNIDAFSETGRERLLNSSHAGDVDTSAENFMYDESNSSLNISKISLINSESGLRLKSNTSARLHDPVAYFKAIKEHITSQYSDKKTLQQLQNESNSNSSILTSESNVGALHQQPQPRVFFHADSLSSDPSESNKSRSNLIDEYPTNNNHTTAPTSRATSAANANVPTSNRLNNNSSSSNNKSGGRKMKVKQNKQNSLSSDDEDEEDYFYEEVEHTNTEYTTGDEIDIESVSVTGKNG